MLEVKTCLNRRRLEQELTRTRFLPDDPLAREAGEIIARVQRGEAAQPRPVSREELEAARGEVSEQFLTSLSIARVNIRRFHECQRRTGYIHPDSEGARIARVVRPLRRVGILCGHSFMALLMHAIPAQVAGVGEIAVAAALREDGAPDPRVLATARSLGLAEVYGMSGAEAVAALALGAGAVAGVDKIVGPGGKRALAAKRLLAPAVGTDGDLGRGEFVVIADSSANARFIACDLLAQAEHEEGGPLLLFTNDRLLAEAVRIEIGRQADSLPNREQLLAALDERGGIHVLPSVDDAVAVANALAPARLSLQTTDNELYLPDVDSAGAIFLGPWAAEMTGGAFTGLNSFLPGNGSARFRSGLGVDDFVRECGIVECGPERLALTGRHLLCLADGDALPAHAGAIRERLSLLHQTVE